MVPFGPPLRVALFVALFALTKSVSSDRRDQNDSSKRSQNKKTSR